MLDIELRPQVQAEVGNIYFKKCAENKKKKGGEEKNVLSLLFSFWHWCPLFLELCSNNYCYHVDCPSELQGMHNSCAFLLSTLHILYIFFTAYSCSKHVTKWLLADFAYNRTFLYRCTWTIRNFYRSEDTTACEHCICITVSGLHASTSSEIFRWNVLAL